jgi:hypothetical protein
MQNLAASANTALPGFVSGIGNCFYNRITVDWYQLYGAQSVVDLAISVNTKRLSQAPS